MYNLLACMVTFVPVNSLGRLTLHNFCLKLSHATCLQLELYCVNQAHNFYFVALKFAALPDHHIDDRLRGVARISGQGGGATKNQVGPKNFPDHNILNSPPPRRQLFW
jgi:hypothetical protein